MTYNPIMFEVEKTPDDTYFCPHWNCAVCGEKIEDASKGIAIHSRDEKANWTGLRAVVHQGACDRRVRAQAEPQPWQHLDVFMHQLLRNSGMLNDEGVLRPPLRG